MDKILNGLTHQQETELYTMVMEMKSIAAIDVLDLEEFPFAIKQAFERILKSYTYLLAMTGLEIVFNE